MMLNFFSIAIVLALFQEFYPAKSRPSLIAVMTALFLECRAASLSPPWSMIISEKIMKEFSRQLQAPQYVILSKASMLLSQGETAMDDSITNPMLLF